jgi:hypothetical protein
MSTFPPVAEKSEVNICSRKRHFFCSQFGGINTITDSLSLCYPLNESIFFRNGEVLTGREIRLSGIQSISFSNSALGQNFETRPMYA